VALTRIHPWERETAIRQLMDTDYTTRLGVRASMIISRRMLSATLRAYREHMPITGPLHAAFGELRPLLVQGMTFARLKAHQRSIDTYEQMKGKPPPLPTTIAAAVSPTYQRGLRFMQRRLELDEAALAEMENQADRHVVRVLAEASKAAEQSLMETMADITAKNLHVRDGVKALRETWQNLGLAEKNKFQLEAIYRTQTQLAYAAGQNDYEQQPEIAEILWGYKYITVGDDRVRPAHRLMDGTTLPKDDPWWQENRAPNGWGCRCQVLQLYDARKSVRPPAEAIADKGFRFNPCQLLPAAA